MADPTDPVAVPETSSPDPEDEAPASRVGSSGVTTPEPLSGTAAMGSETGGLAGTSR